MDSGSLVRDQADTPKLLLGDRTLLESIVAFTREQTSLEGEVSGRVKFFLGRAAEEKGAPERERTVEVVL